MRNLYKYLYKTYFLYLHEKKFELLDLFGLLESGPITSSTMLYSVCQKYNIINVKFYKKTSDETHEILVLF